MKARVIVAGHAVHAQMIAFPLGLLGISPLWDILGLFQGRDTWATVAYWTIVAGVVSALLAAIPGFLDYLKIPRRTRAKAVGTYHLLINLFVVALFALTLALRAAGDRQYVEASVGAMIPGWLGVALLVVSGWLGGELVETLGIGVHEGAHPNAPSSLSGRQEPRPSRETADVNVTGSPART